MDEFLAAAFSLASPARLPPFTKYLSGQWNQPGIGGLSSTVLPGPSPTYSGTPYVTYSDFLHCYVVILDDSQNISYAESRDGVLWTMPHLLKTFTSEPATGIYAAAIGKEQDPRHLGKQFYVYCTYYPNNGGWDTATVRRLTVSCKESDRR